MIKLINKIFTWVEAIFLLFLPVLMFTGGLVLICWGSNWKVTSGVFLFGWALKYVQRK